MFNLKQKTMGNNTVIFVFRGILSLILFCTLQNEIFSQTIMFDDFTYSGVNELENPASASNKWSVVNGQSGPPAGANYSRDNIEFVTDPSNPNNKWMKVSTTVNGSSRAIVNSRVESAYEYFEGTYASRVYLTDEAFGTKDGNIQTYFTIVPSSLAQDGSKYSELDIVEYMAADKWGLSPNNQVLYTTSYHKYIADPWKPWKTYTTQKQSYAGWHTFMAVCTDKVNIRYFIDGVLIATHSVTDNETQAGLPVYPRSTMMIAYANWIAANDLGSSTTNRTNTMQVDWTLHYKNTALSYTEVNNLVNSYRASGLQRRNMAGQTYITASTNQAPTVGLTAPSNNATFAAPAAITIAANAADADGSISKVEFYNGTTLLNSDATTPYSYTWNNVGTGTYTITAKATDNIGAVTTSSAITVTVNPIVITQSPYSGTAAAIPGTIEAAKYDIGGQNIAFYDNTTGNSGNTFRADDVDIEACTEGGYNVGWTAANEWTEYTVNVTANTYKIEARVAATAAGKSFRVEMDGATVATFSIPNTGGWQTWQTVTINNVSLSGGQKVMRIYNITDGFNVSNIKFTEATSPPPIGPAVVYQNCNNDTGYAIALNVGTYTTAQLNALGVADNDISRVTVQAGYQVTLYTDNNFGGSSIILTSEASCLTSNNFNDVVSSIKVSLVLPNQAPTVSLTAPTNTTYTAPASITISANASDADGSVSKVDFYTGSTLLNSDASAPYTYTWTGVGVGTYNITAKATDNNGAVATSNVAMLTVNTAITGSCSNTPQYLENGGYVDGSKVQIGGKQYQCKPWPYYYWCNGSAWAYEPGTGYYWTDAWTLIGSCNARTAADLSNNSSAIVNENMLTNAPNPFHENTTIEINLANKEEVSIKIYDQTGQVITTIAEGNLNAGLHQFEFNTTHLTPGLYIVKCNTSSGVIARKIIKAQ